MSKFGTFSDYPPRSLLSSEAALLTAWRSLDQYWDDLVLIGGLAVHYLTRRRDGGLPGAVTLDVDFGISLAAEGGQYGTIKTTLAGLGFVPEKERLARKYEDVMLYLDFLTDGPPLTKGTRMVDDVVASVIPGIERALASRRMVKVTGADLYGGTQTCSVPVADIGPLLVLKLNAFGGPTGRRHPKDAYDVLLAVTQFIDGPGAAVAAFQAEGAAGNPAYQHAVATLRADFSELGRDGPTRAAQFLLSPNADPVQRQRVQQDVVNVGQTLLGN